MSYLDKDINDIELDSILDWLQYHETAWDDAVEFFNIEISDIDDKELSRSDLEYDAFVETIDRENLIDWISEHDTLYEDFCRFFHIKD